MSDMKSSSDYPLEETISHTITIQSESIASLIESDTIDEITQVARVISGADGRVLFSGIGKSGDVAEKIAATFNSIGVPSQFIHPVEALHGDFGAISEEDIVVLVSNSGNTDEVVELLRFLQSVSVPTVSITSDPDSKLGTDADYHINTRVDEEGSVIDLVPMASATVTMVVGDCLANVLMRIRNFGKQEYGQFHPGGIIGKRLLLDAEDILYTDIPPTKPDETLIEVAVKMSKGGKGIAVVQDDEGKVLGILTDGDMRRLIESETDLHKVVVEDVMIQDPITVQRDISAITALEMIEDNDINHLIVVDDQNYFEGIVDFHGIVEAGLTTGDGEH
jgi:arabinose-5-phosphate isomerase